MLVKRWLKQDVPLSLRDALSGELRVSPTTASILINRGIKEKEEAEIFLRVSLDDLGEPFSIKDMDRIVARVIKAVREGEKILVFGDYDADGITGTALLVQFFRDLGREVSYYIPRRLDEGYGISLRALKRIKEMGVGLIITVDCGISSVEEVEAASRMGMDIIITDHHEPPDVLPDAFAVLSPGMKGSGYPFKSLAGVGVALKLAQAVKAGLEGRDKAGPGIDKDLLKFLDLVALGTIADVVPLKGENRILVKHGLERLKNSTRVGMRKLKEVALINNASFGAGSVGFQIAPRLNASGRLGQAEAGVRLLITEDPAEALSIAMELDAMNRERQKLEEAILDEARGIMHDEYDMECKTIVLASEKWHQGVIGIVASKLVEEYYRPTVLISMNEGIGKGSARSIPAFHLYDGLEKCSMHLEGFGGHKFAAGLSIKREMLDSFRSEFESLVDNTLTSDDFIPSLKIDGEVPLSGLTFGLHEELSVLEPFGCGNPEPVLSSSRLEVMYPKVFGKNHVRMKLAQKGFAMNSVGFNMGSIYQSLAMKRMVVDAAFCLDVKEWQGERRLQLNLKDLHF